MSVVHRVGERVGRTGYEILDAPNRGSMALSYAARAPGGEKVFLKEFNDPTPLSDWYRPYIAYQEELKRRVETTDFRGFCYRFIEFFEFEVKPGRPYYYQVFEFVPNGLSLDKALDEAADHPERLPWDRRVIMAKVMMAGIKAMHAAGIVHSDLKPDNLILIPVDPRSPATAYKLRIIDLDFSLLADRMPPPWHGHDDLGYFGTEGYMSPEHVQPSGPGRASDVFTCGLMLYQVLSREGHPYRRYEGQAYFEAAAAHRAPPPTLLDTLPAPAKNDEAARVIHQCLAPRAADRPSAEDVHKALLGFSPSRPSAPPPPLPKRVEAPPVAVPPPAASARQRLVLRSATGGTLDFGIRTPVGRTLCRSLGEDYKFVSDPCQFTVDLQGGTWVVIPTAGTANETLLNGRTVTGPTPLKAGDVLGVGDAARAIVKLPLTVEFTG